MRIRALLSSLVVATIAAAPWGSGIIAGPLESAQAEEAGDATVVHGLRFPLGSPVQLSWVGCTNLYDRAPETLAPRISTDAALGERSVSYDLAGGNAVGTLAYVDSVARTGAVGLEVKTEPGATGVAYAVYQTSAQRRTDRLWIGRESLRATSDDWTTFDVVHDAYSWTQVDGRTGRALGPPTTGTIAAATRRTGDGPGFFTVGFGCDGSPFALDALRLDGVVDDLEGFEARVGIGASATSVPAGAQVTLTGSLSDGLGAPIPQGSLVLEASTDQQHWSPVAVVDASSGGAPVAVAPTQTTYFRFHFAERDIAPEADSSTIKVEVMPKAEGTDATKAGEHGSESPTATASSRPSATPSRQPSRQPSQPVSSRPSPQASKHPAGHATTRPPRSSSPTPAAEPSETPSTPSRQASPASTPRPAG